MRIEFLLKVLVQNRRQFMLAQIVNHDQYNKG